MLIFSEKSRFIEKVIDDQAPQDLWMKTIGDVNKDGLTDIIVGAWQGGIAAFLAPDWKIIISALCIGAPIIKT
jgi:hypothetical protein